jgi:hypothetical protein
VRFLKQIDRQKPRDLDLHLIADITSLLFAVRAPFGSAIAWYACEDERAVTPTANPRVA